MNAIVWRGLERILIVIAATIIAYLGYLLFKKGVDSNNTVQVDNVLGKFIISGSGPGLTFMIFSSFILMYALLHGSASITTSPQLDQVTQSLDILQKQHNENTTAINQVIGAVTTLKDSHEQLKKKIVGQKVVTEELKVAPIKLPALLPEEKKK